MHACAALTASICILALGTVGCSQKDSADLESASFVRVEVDSADPERIVRYYLGSYLGTDAGDPFQRGLTLSRSGRIYLNLDSLHALYPPSVDALSDVNGNGRIDWEELETFLQNTYHDARALPSDIERFRATFDYESNPERWFVVEVNGVMTTARRRVHVSLDALRAALGAYRSNDDRLLYPVGTAIVGEHLMEGRLAETTAMVKRSDGFWDFLTYDEAGALASSTTTPPRPLDSPTQCVGCHFGSKQFEPEASFPGEARPGPHGPRVLHVHPTLRVGEVVDFFNEHDRRSDTVLGLYATLFVAQLQAERRASTIEPGDANLLSSLGL